MARPHVLVTRSIPEPGLALLRAECEVDLWEGPLPPSTRWLAEHAAGKHGILALLTERIDGPLMDAAGPQLKVISNFAVGTDNIDLAGATRRRIAVGHTPDVLTETTADLAFALLMSAARRLAEAQQYVREGHWRTWDPNLLLGTDVHGATLGVLGFGRIGQAVARRAKGFSMRVLASGGRIAAEGPGAIAVDLPALLAQSDFISLHAPLTSKTRGLIDARAFAQMKKGAILVNTARGGLVDSAALVDALRSGPIAGAALDVTDPEPLPAGHPLLSLPNCLVVPHIGSATVATRSRISEMAARNLLAGVRGQPLPNRANP